MFRRRAGGNGAEKVQVPAGAHPFEELTVEMPIVLDDAGWVVRAGDAWERLLGHPAAELAGRPLHDLIHSDDASAAAQELRRAVEPGAGLVRFECRFADCEGKHVWLEWDAQASGDGLVHAVARDLTEKRRATDEVDRAREKALRAESAESAFLSRMSHELRTPLTSVIGFSELLMRDDLTADQELKVLNVLKAGRHLLSLIDEVLDVSQVDGGAPSVSTEPIAIRGLLNDAIALAQPQAADREIEIRTDLEPCADLYAMADPQRLRQVVLNLLSNAVKYNRTGGEVEVSCETVDATLRVRVRDTGPGLDEHQLGRLFVPFDRLGAEDTSIQGTGLGLVLSRRLIELMGGTLSVESEVGKGTVFIFELGLAEAPAATASSSSDRGPAASGELASHTVLVIEDNTTNLELITELLTASGARVLTARDGRSGLSAARQERPDLILLDVHLPDFDGRLVLEALQRDSGAAEIPVIALSADATRDQRQNLFDRGVTGYVTKPFEAEALVASIGQALSNTAREPVRT